MSEEEKDESKEDEFENNEKERKDSNGVDELNENEKNDGEELWNNDNNLETEIKSENSVDNEPKPKKKIKK